MDPDEVRGGWAGREGEFSPAYYAYYGPDETSEFVRSVLARRVGTDAEVLEVGCGPGRHLAHLRREGFEHLTGVEINDEAVAVMADEYPELADAATVHVGSIETTLADLPADRFDAVYSVQTLQHVHPESDAFDEIARVTGDLLVTVESEADDPGPPGDPEVNYVDEDLPLYYRDYGRVFGRRGFEELEVEATAEEPDGDTARAFRARGD